MTNEQSNTTELSSGAELPTTEQMLQAMTHPVFPHEVCITVGWEKFTVSAYAAPVNGDGFYPLTKDHEADTLEGAVRACYEEFKEDEK